MADKAGKLTILAERGGTIGEVTRFLSDLESAYDALYLFERSWRPERIWRQLPPEIWWELGYPVSLAHRRGRLRFIGDSVPPRSKLTLERVRIESPGFWEFAASLNPLQQIREYLNDRHRRRQDKEFREAAEKERLALATRTATASITGSLTIGAMPGALRSGCGRTHARPMCCTSPIVQ
jgi:hypothetical protein